MLQTLLCVNTVCDRVVCAEPLRERMIALKKF